MDSNQAVHFWCDDERCTKHLSLSSDQNPPVQKQNIYKDIVNELNEQAYSLLWNEVEYETYDVTHKYLHSTTCSEDRSITEQSDEEDNSKDTDAEEEPVQENKAPVTKPVDNEILNEDVVTNQKIANKFMYT
jgi:hypothetical protein